MLQQQQQHPANNKQHTTALYIRARFRGHYTLRPAVSGVLWPREGGLIDDNNERGVHIILYTVLLKRSAAAAAAASLDRR